MSDIERFVLGTAQLGGHYGISNTVGEIQESEAEGIIRAAVLNGISKVDTAPAYGKAESILGNLLSSLPALRISTKLPSVKSLPPGSAPSLTEALIVSVTESLRRLRRASVQTLLVHDIDDVTGSHGLAIKSALMAIKRRGLARQVGFSAYTLEQVDKASEVLVPDVVQLPISVYDQRLVRNCGVQSLASRGIEVHARSIFLQGLVLMSPDAVEMKFGFPARAHQEQFHGACEDLGVTPLKACIDFVRQVEGLAQIVVGATSSQEVIEVCGAATSPRRSTEWRAYEHPDGLIVNPTHWS